MIKLNERLLAVGGTLKEIIEEFDPGLHQFWPITIIMPKGKEYPTPYCGMVVRRFLDRFRPEHSDQGSWHRAESGLYFVLSRRRSSSLGLHLRKRLLMALISGENIASPRQKFSWRMN